MKKNDEVLKYFPDNYVLAMAENQIAKAPSLDIQVNSLILPTPYLQTPPLSKTKKIFFKNCSFNTFSWNAHQVPSMH